MINDSNKTEIIELYLQGQLTQELADEFNQKLLNDQDFRQEVELQRAIMQNAKRVGRAEMKQALMQIHSEVISKSEDNVAPFRDNIIKSEHLNLPKNVNPSRRLKVIFAAAASLIMLGALIYYSSLSPHKLFIQHFEPYKTALVRAEEETNNLIQLYEQKNYSAVTQGYEEKGWNSIKDTFIAGNAYLMLSQPSKAIRCFERVININKNLQPEKRRFLDDAEYHLALACLAANRLDEADILFKKISEDETHAYHDRIDNALLFEIKLLKIKE